MRRDRRGFTLIELLIVAVLGSLVMGAVLQILITNQRTYTAQTATVSGQQSTRMALDILLAELREVSPEGGDIIAMADDSIRVRLMRKFGYVCDTDFSGQPRLLTIPLGIGTNTFTAGDSVFVFADNDPDTDDDDVWIEASVTATAAGVCPQNAEVAQWVGFNGQGAIFTADSVGLGAPVREFRTFTFGTTTFLGDVYLGRREGNGDMIPVTGPLRRTDGLELVYRDEFGDITSDERAVRQIDLVVRTGSEVLNSLGEMVSDSIEAVIYVRN